MVTVKHLKHVAKRNNIKNYSKLRKEALQTLLREHLPIDVFIEEIQRSNREEFIRKLGVAIRAKRASGAVRLVNEQKAREETVARRLTALETVCLMMTIQK